MASGAFLVATIFLISFFAITCNGVTFSSLQEHKTLLVSTSLSSNQAQKAGEDKVTVTWSYNNTFPAGTDSSYKTVKIKLCYAPVSQKDRLWRKTVDELKKDKTCQFKIVSKPYIASNNTFVWTIERDIPTATYFVRVYAIDFAGEEVAFGQSTDHSKTTNLFDVQAITGRHTSLDISAVCFSVFSVGSLFAFFTLEKRKARASQNK